MPYDLWKTDIDEAIRTRIGQELAAQYDAAQPLPERISVLLMRLDEPPKKIAGATADGEADNSPGIGEAFAQGFATA